MCNILVAHSPYAYHIYCCVDICYYILGIHTSLLLLKVWVSKAYLDKDKMHFVHACAYISLFYKGSTIPS